MRKYSNKHWLLLMVPSQYKCAECPGTRFLHFSQSGRKPMRYLVLVSREQSFDGDADGRSDGADETVSVNDA
jgi:hypothetical protein